MPCLSRVRTPKGDAKCASGHGGHPAKPGRHHEWSPALLCPVRPLESGGTTGETRERRKERNLLRQVWLNLKINNQFPKGKKAKTFQPPKIKDLNLILYPPDSCGDGLVGESVTTLSDLKSFLLLFQKTKVPRAL